MKVKRIEELPEGKILEELRVCYKKGKRLRQEVTFFAERAGKKITAVKRNGEKIEERNFKNIQWLSYLVRS